MRYFNLVVATLCLMAKDNQQRQGGAKDDKPTTDDKPDAMSGTAPVIDPTMPPTALVETSEADKAQQAIDQQAIELAAFLRLNVPATRDGLMAFAWHDRAAAIVKAIKGVDIPRKAANGRTLNPERRRLGDICRAIGGGYWSVADDNTEVMQKVLADFASTFHKSTPVDCLATCRAIVVAVLEGRKVASAGGKGIALTPASVEAFKAELAKATS